MDTLEPVVRALTPSRASFVLHQEAMRSLQTAVDEKDRASQKIAQVDQQIAEYQHRKNQYTKQVKDADERIAVFRNLETIAPIDYFLDPCTLQPVQARAIGGTILIDSTLHVSLVLGDEKHMFVSEDEANKRPHAKVLYDAWKAKADEARARMNSPFPLGTLEQLQSIIDADEIMNADLSNYPTLLPTVIDKKEHTMDVFLDVLSVSKSHGISIAQLLMLSGDTKHVVADDLRSCPLSLTKYSARWRDEKSAQGMADPIPDVFAPITPTEFDNLLASQPTEGDDAAACVLTTPPRRESPSPRKKRRKQPTNRALF